MCDNVEASAGSLYVEGDIISTPFTNKYRVSANKHEYVTAGFDTREEATRYASELLGEGFDNVSISNTETEGSIW